MVNALGIMMAIEDQLAHSSTSPPTPTGIFLRGTMLYWISDSDTEILEPLPLKLSLSCSKTIGQDKNMTCVIKIKKEGSKESCIQQEIPIFCHFSGDNLKMLNFDINMKRHLLD